jgi:hypothetical protein
VLRSCNFGNNVFEIYIFPQLLLRNQDIIAYVVVRLVMLKPTIIITTLLLPHDFYFQINLELCAFIIQLNETFCEHSNNLDHGGAHDLMRDKEINKSITEIFFHGEETH